MSIISDLLPNSIYGFYSLNSMYENWLFLKFPFSCLCQNHGQMEGQHPTTSHNFSSTASIIAWVVERPPPPDDSVVDPDDSIFASEEMEGSFFSFREKFLTGVFRWFFPEKWRFGNPDIYIYKPSFANGILGWVVDPRISYPTHTNHWVDGR